MAKMNQKLWDEVIELGHINEPESKGIANKLDKNDIITILASMEYWGASAIWLKQTQYDLWIPKFRVFDWLAMCINGRNDDNRQFNNTALKVLVYSFLKVKGNVKAFIDDLRVTDYEIVRDWETINIEGE